MKRTELIITIIFPAYLSIVILTKISLVGFWTDVFFTIGLSCASSFYIFKSKMPMIGKVVHSICFGFVLSMVLVGATTPFFWEYLKTRSFCFRKADGRLFNAYFRPVGSYSGGYGRLSITETYKYFPLIEWQVFYNKAVDWDFVKDKYDGQPVDSVVLGYIMHNVLDAESK